MLYDESEAGNIVNNWYGIDVESSDSVSVHWFNGLTECSVSYSMRREYIIKSKNFDATRKDVIDKLGMVSVLMTDDASDNFVYLITYCLFYLYGRDASF